MYILTQDETNLVNINGTTVLAINDKGNGNEIHALINHYLEKGQMIVILGKYRSNKDAKKVLKKIYINSENDNNYTMPDEYQVDIIGD